MDKTQGSKSRPFPVTTLFKQERKESERVQVTYRIPALLYISENQTFLAFAEKRKTADDTDADVLVMRKGIWKDDGVEWDSQELLSSACQANRRCMNPCPVFERESKTLFLFFITVPVGVSEHKQIHKNKNQARLCYITSKDTGKTWSAVTDLTADVIGEQEKDWATFAVGPGHGVQLKSGRLIIPAYVYPCRSHNCKATSCAFALYSDDKGSTWRLGKRMDGESNECQMAEIIDDKGVSTLYCNARTTLGYRTEALSYNSGQDFATVLSPNKLIETGNGCQGSVLSFLQQSDPPITYLLYSHPSNPENRVDLGLYLNKTPLDSSGWSDVPAMILHHGPSAYADLVEHEPGRFACLMECGIEHENEEIAFLLFELPAKKL
ncbi:sialidase-4-like isoform X2 [Labeo rohita]|uniref:sialidase-4-like isoform X2 n=1 Tax=Labeo rohita TaxID=84645 RepID=UPI0021E211CC|nr:sialidase-4-like isoform X2 [Labeo rohita]XP_050949296.1 sialidase-4-like isoform X2 [Labeo rohita]XP_050949297.1 sialidase-4-like isoform X2 [Labeo rohita]